MSQKNIMLRIVKDTDTKLQCAKNFIVVKGSNDNAAETLNLMDNIYGNMVAANFNYCRAEDGQHDFLMGANNALFNLNKRYFETCFAYLSVVLDEIPMEGGDKNAKTRFYVSSK